MGCRSVALPACCAVKAFKAAIVSSYHCGENDVTAFKAVVGDAGEVRLLKW